MSFARTAGGKSAKYLFHPSTVLVWVEGDDDLSAYNWLVRDLNCRLEPAGGKDECLQLARDLVRDDLQYVVVIDGDYEVLTRRRSSHRRVIWLGRYAIENYLVEPPCIERLCDALRAPIDAETGRRIEDALADAEGHLEEAIILDAAAVASDRPQSPLPNAIERLLEDGRGCRIDSEAVLACCAIVEADIDAEVLTNARGLVERWIQNHRLFHLVRGHLAFGFVRNLIFAEVRRRGHKLTLDNRALLVLLSAEVWNSALPQDHRSLSRRVHRAVKEVGRVHNAA